MNREQADRLVEALGLPPVDELMAPNAMLAELPFVRVDSVTIHYRPSPARPKPKTGDRRTTKKYGLEIRIPVRVTFGPHTGAYVVSRGRQLFDWASPAEAFKLYPHLMTAEERAEARV